ncbi:CAP domain-containing protein [Oerskovia sp. NPDC056781]|uniref:CAP domain-containing protein n=1 Tax=Oerskovia sp. NPDC056781 TaxID=3345942 RepID=UPI003673571A
MLPESPLPDHLPQTRAARRLAEQAAVSPSRAQRRRRRAEAVRHARSTGATGRVRGPRALPQVAVVTLGLVGGLLVVPATQELGGEGPGLEPIGARWDAALGRGDDRAGRGGDGREPLLAEAGSSGTSGNVTQPSGSASAERPTDAPSSPEPPVDEAPAPPEAPAAPPQQGATGPEVQQVQERLQVHGATVPADGVFGPGTDRALRTFQDANGLEPDGVAGPATRAALLAEPTTTPAATGSAEGATSSGAGDTAGDTTAALTLVNAHRTAAGCPALRADEQLGRAATLHAQDMVAQGYFSHTSLDGRTFGDRVTAQGYARPGGENIAAGQKTAQAVVDAWMASEGHRANILNCDFTTMGLGRAGDTWVQVFGY